MNKRSVLMLFTILIVTMATGISWGNTIMREWEIISTDFLKDDKPYGAGDFRIRDNQIISFKLADAETVFKPGSAEYTEPWMNNIDEQMNRRSVRILTGTINGVFRRVFDKPGQQGAWWLSPDWSVIYVSTGWMDYREQRAPGERYTPQLTELFKSTDQGQTWRQLKWPQNGNISQIDFLDTQRGYAVGWGPHIWRTANGGESWTEIPVPPQAKDPRDPRKEFDMVALGKDGVLRFTFTAQNPQQQAAASQVYSLSWNDTVPSLVFTLPDQIVTDIIDHQNNLYILTWRGTSIFNVNDPAQTTLFRLTNQNIETLYEFEQGFKGYSLYITPGGGILMGGENGQNFSVMTALSYDQGKSWKIENEGGSYYDSETGTIWQVMGYVLLKRQIP